MSDDAAVEAVTFDRYLPRRDVSQVPPQGGYVAKHCPQRVEFDVFPPAGVVPQDPPPGARLRMDEGVAFEALVVAQLLELHPGGTVIDQERSAEQQQADTAAAMAAGAELVLGGWLPTDLVGRRVGRPDVLVRAERRADGAWAYHPADVKHHLTLKADVAKADEVVTVPRAVVASMTDPAWASSAVADQLIARSNTADLLQLAHYRRMLEQTPHASADAVGAIIGKEGQVVWLRLDEPVVRRLWDGSEEAKEAALQRYDFEFSFRLDVIAAAAAGESLVEPVLVSECPSCPWRGRCIPQIVASDSTSLLPGFGYRQWHALRRVGVTSRAGVAELDLAAAQIRDAVHAARGDLVAAVAEAEVVHPHTPVADVLGDHPEGPSSPTVQVLVDHGIATAADLVALDPTVVALAGPPIARLAEAIRGARVITGDGVPQLRDGVEALVVPSGDVEIDIDMENAIDGTVYLWGAWVDGTYHAAVGWEPPSAQVDAEVFVAFWDWLSAQRSAAAAAGRSVRIYCWSQQAESGALLRGAAAAADLLGRPEARAEVAELLASDQWVDLLEEFRTQLITGLGNGLKVVAGLAGFSWRDSDPNGEDSMAWYATAVGDGDPAAVAAARARLLAYNEDDVRATAAVRAWMRGLPSARTASVHH